MKRKSILTILFALMFILIINIPKSFGVSIAELATQGQAAVGQTIDIRASDLLNNPNLYCILQGQENSGNTTYKVLTHIHIEDGIATVKQVTEGSAHVSGESRANKILAEIVSGNYGLGYGSAYHNYTDAQKAVYYYLTTWISEVGESVLINHSWDANNNYADDGTAASVITRATAAVDAGANPTVDLYLLDDWEGKAGWQRLMIVNPSTTSNGQVVIRKVSSETGERMGNVGLTIRSLSTGEYISSVELIDANSNIMKITGYTTNSSSAFQFKTKSNKDIILQGLTSGKYQITETANPNSGYEGNKGVTKTFLLNSNSSATITIYNSQDEPDNPGDEPGAGEGNVSISGTVWEYEASGKNSSSISKKGSVSGIKVYWKDSSGNTLATTTTDSNGNYTMKGTISTGSHKYNLDEKAYSKYNNSYIEFEYNGLKYTTIAASKTLGDNKSVGTEIQSTRSQLDDKVQEIAGNGSNSEVKSGGQTITYSRNGHTSNAQEVLQNYNSSFSVRANTKITGIKKLLDDHATTTQSYYCSRHHYTKHHSDGHQCSGKHCDFYDKEDDSWTVTNMNLGLVTREQPDIALKTDISKVRVIMKGQEYTYNYGHRGIANISAPNVQFSNDGKVYSRPINPSDIQYIAENNSNDLEVYVTYDTIVYNQSNTLKMTVPEIANYYDQNYELVSSGWSTSSKYGHTYNSGGYKAIYNTSLSGTVLEPGAKSQTVSVEFKVKTSTLQEIFNKNNKTLREHTDLFDVAEVSTYSTYYGSSTMCAEQKNASSAGLVGQSYAGIDKDSAPLNATPGNEGTYEDDTDKAPVFQITIDDEKIVSGTVWEDTQTSESKANNERLGNGTKDNGENGVGNVKVELLKADTNEVALLYPRGQSSVPAVTTTAADGSYNFTGVVVDNYIIRYTYGGDIDYNNTKITSIINGNEIDARNYKSTIITTDPVKSVINGSSDSIKWHLTEQDNASVAVDDLSNANGGRANIDNKDLIYSNFAEKQYVSSYTKPFKIQVEYTENQEQGVKENGQPTGADNFTYNWPVFDFGIIERPREDMVIDKTISNLKITLANGQVLIEGDPRKDTLSYVKSTNIKNGALTNTLLNTREAVKKSNEKLLSIEMDSELIQGSTIDITYAITVTNNNEKDYVYSTNQTGYYYYGNKNSLDLIRESANLVVDYMDSDLTCVAGSNTENSDWTQVQADTLKNTGYISEETFNTVQPSASNYLIFITDKFKDLASGESTTSYIHASKLLANKASDYTFENHVEIIRLDGKTARTIDSTESTGKQVAKTYKPGTYIPSLNRVTATYTALTDTRNRGRLWTDASKVKNDSGATIHTQDDDMIRITITPPTGSTNNVMTYIIAGLVSLSIVAVGIYIIKKKIVL